MPFLTLNGVTIPTRAGGEIKNTEYGERTAGFDGSAQIDVRGVKRKWQFNTKPISMVRSRAIEGLVRGLGLYVPFDTGGGTSTGLYTASGAYPTVLNGTPTIFNATAADGAASYDENAVRYTMVGNSSAAFDPSSTNAATAAVASCSATTGWTQGGTLTVSSTRYWEGTSSLNWAPSAVNQAVYAPLYASATSNQWWTVSCYVYCANYTNLLTLQMIGVSNAVIASKSIVHPGGGWYRFWITARIPSTSVGLAISSQDTSQVFLDGVQYERAVIGATTSPPTSFMAGGVTRAFNDITWGFTYPNPTGFTLSLWTADVNGLQNQSGLFTVYDTSGNTLMYMVLTALSSTVGTLDFNIRTSTGYVTMSATVTLPMNAWNHIAVVYSGRAYTNTAGTTFPNILTYLNGTLLTSSTLTTDLTGPFGSVQIGSSSGNSLWGRVDDVQILPFGADARWVSDTYTASSSLARGAYGVTGLTPFLTAAGNAIDGAPVTVYGTVESATYVGFQDPTYGWISQGRSLQIVLTEA